MLNEKRKLQNTIRLMQLIGESPLMPVISIQLTDTWNKFVDDSVSWFVDVK